MSVAELAPRDIAATSDPSTTSVTPRRDVSRALVGLVVAGIALRVLWSTHNGASFDESFTAMLGRRGLGSLFDALRTSDSHPPLDYLIRAPFARAGATDTVMRLPSLLFSGAALALFAWWMRQRGVAAVVAVALMAVSPFQIMYGGEARMYALLELLGVSAAVLADAWLRAPRRWHAPVVGAVVLVGVFDHVSGLLLAAGLLALAGLRCDRETWRWRAWIAGALALWAVLWGPFFVQQASTTHASWISRTTLSGISSAVSGLVTTESGVALVICAVVAAGLVVAARADRTLARVMLCCGVLPVVAAASIGLRAPFFVDRTLTIAAWMPCVAIGLAVQRVGRVSRLYGAAAAILVAALVVPSALLFVNRHWEYDASVEHLAGVVAPGDVVATIPGWYGPLVDWRIGVRMFGTARPVDVAELPGASAIKLGNRRGDRTWVLWFAGDHRTFPHATRCARDWSDGVIVVSCLVGTSDA